MLGSAFKSSSPDLGAAAPHHAATGEPLQLTASERWERAKCYGGMGDKGVFGELDVLKKEVVGLRNALAERDRQLADRDDELARLREEVLSLRRQAGAAVTVKREGAGLPSGGKIGSRNRALADTEEHLTLAYMPLVRELEDEVDDLRARLSLVDKSVKATSNVAMLQRHKSQPTMLPQKK